MPEKERLRRLAGRGLTEWAHWSAISHAVRGHGAGAASLFRLAISQLPLWR